MLTLYQNSILAYIYLLTVPPKSIDITGGPSHTVTENVDYNLTCIARESNPAVTMTWLVDNVPVAVRILERKIIDNYIIVMDPLNSLYSKYYLNDME